jgi:hypothetical protein
VNVRVHAGRQLLRWEIASAPVRQGAGARHDGPGSGCTLRRLPLANVHAREC